MTAALRFTWLAVHLAAIALGIWLGVRLFEWAT